MPESITCPHCRRLLEMPATFDGGEVCCPQCQKVFVGDSLTAISAQAPQPIASPAATDVQPGMPPALDSGRVPADEDGEIDSFAFVDKFRSGSNLALTTKWLLGLNLLVSLALLGGDYLQYELADRLIAGEIVPHAELESNDSRQMAIGVIHFLAFLGCTIVFLFWFHRAHANLEPLGARGLAYTSGWAVGCWFVPILNLFRPVQIAQEIWRNSDPEAIGSRTDSSGNSGLIALWWATWIISNMISNFSTRMSWSVTSPQGLKSATAAGMAAEVVTIISALFALAVVSAIDARQTARAEALTKARSSRRATYD